LSAAVVLPSPPLTLLFSFLFLSIVQRSRLSYLCCLTLFFVDALHHHGGAKVLGSRVIAARSYLVCEWNTGGPLEFILENRESEHVI
jgi:hypothetical protein